MHALVNFDCLSVVTATVSKYMNGSVHVRFCLHLETKPMMAKLVRMIESRTQNWFYYNNCIWFTTTWTHPIYMRLIIIMRGLFLFKCHASKWSIIIMAVRFYAIVLGFCVLLEGILICLWIGCRFGIFGLALCENFFVQMNQQIVGYIRIMFVQHAQPFGYSKDTGGLLETTPCDDRSYILFYFYRKQNGT